MNMPSRKTAARLKLAALVCSTTLLAACGGNAEPAPDEWRPQAEAAVGQPIADWGTYSEVWRDFCKTDDDAFALRTAAFLDNRVTTVELHVNVAHACPDRLDDLAEVLELLGRD